LCLFLSAACPGASALLEVAVSVCVERTASERFHARLEKVRAKIARLPADQQPEFLTLVDEVAVQHESRQSDSALVRRLIKDLHFIAKSVQFELEVFRGDLS